MTTEPNHIIAEQNTPRRLEMLAAQRELYSRAKRVFAIGAIASVAGPVLWISIAAAFAPFRPWAALLGIVVAAVDLIFLDGWQRRLQKTAADVQEDFDCDVLRIARNPIKRSGFVDPEVVREAAGRYRARDAELVHLRDWYPASVQALPMPLARLVCQRTNLRWDAQLRRIYAGGILTVVFVLSILTLVLGLASGVTADSLVLRVLAPALPAIVWGMREFTRQREAANEADRVKSHVERLWSSALAGEVAESWDGEARAIQDEIFDRRRRGPLVFDWVYERLRSRYEEQAAGGAEALARIAVGPGAQILPPSADRVPAKSALASPTTMEARVSSGGE
jgi:hypothetical protein